jgi:pectate lyase
MNVARLLCFLTLLNACAPDSGQEENSGAKPSAPEQGGEGGDTAVPSNGGAGGEPATGGSDVGGTDGSGGDASRPGLDCSAVPFDTAALLAENVGFGAQADGGDPALVYHVTTLASSGPGSLQDALEADTHYWIVFDVDGHITLDAGAAKVKSHRTVDGRGHDITIEGNLVLEDAKDVILTDLRLTNSLEPKCGQAGDVITVKGNGTTPASYSSRNLWFHHLELFDGGDGLLDLRGASGVTVSWSHLHSHKKGMLASRNSDGSEAPGMQVTFHHNHFDRISLRGPQFLFGQAHYFNNYQDRWYEYGASSLAGAELLSESNVYRAREGSYCVSPCPDPNPCGDDDFFVSKKALVTDWSGNGTGSAKSVGDLALEGAIIEENQPGSVFDPTAHYGYALEPASETLASKVAAGVGPRTDYCSGM